MNKLIEKDDCGNWSLKGVRWSNLMPGALITKDTYEKVYAALCKLMDYEDTELDPEDVERINDFDKSQSGKMLKKLNEEQRKHRWIPVSERLPELGKEVLTQWELYDRYDDVTNVYIDKLWINKMTGEWNGVLGVPSGNVNCLDGAAGAVQVGGGVEQ